MRMPARLGLALLVLPGSYAAGANPVQRLEDRPTLVTPARPPTRVELDRSEALKLYAEALLRERNDQLLEATRLLEQARDLNSEGAYLHRALIPLYLALCRNDDAIAACRKVVDLDPADYRTWYLLARRLKDEGRVAEALVALERAASCAGMKEHPDLLVQLRYDQGILFEEKQEYARAEAAFREAARMLEHPEALAEAGAIDPLQVQAETAKSYEAIGRVCTEAKRYDEAVQAYRKACRLDPERAGRLNYLLAKVCVAQGNARAALEALNGYLLTQPQGTDAYELKITLLKQVGRAAEVLPALEEHARRDAHHIALHGLLAREYAEAGHVEEAETLYKKLTAETPAPEIYHGLFDLYRKNGRLLEALDLLNAAVKSARDTDGRPGNAVAAAEARAMLTVLREDGELAKLLVIQAFPSVRAGRNLDFQTCMFLAVLAGQTHQLPEAEQFYRDCLKGPFADPRIEATVYDGLLRVLHEQRKFRDMEEVCRTGLKRPGATSQLLLHNELAVALAQQDKADEAIREADEVVRLMPAENTLSARLGRVRILSLVGRHERAAAECLDLLKGPVRPDDELNIRYTLSAVYSEGRAYGKAEDQLRRILKDHPEEAQAHNDLGYIMADQGEDLAEAERLIRRALELDRQAKRSGKTVPTEGTNDNAAYLDSLGWVLFRRGQTDEARTWLEKAVGLEEGASDPVVWDHLGDVCYRLEETPRALACWQKAVDLYDKERRRRPDDRYLEVKRKLQLLGPAAPR
jgi:tetratricopeptide (TPR) repeat protein